MTNVITDAGIVKLVDLVTPGQRKEQLQARYRSWQRRLNVP